MTAAEIEDILRSKPDGWWRLLVEEIPELNPLAETIQSPIHHQEGDVATHTRMAVSACPENCDPDLLWAALLHDIGKPLTTKKHNGGKVTAFKHDHVGSIISEEIVTRFQMSQKRKKKIIWAIKNHLFYHFWQLGDLSQLSKKQLEIVSDPNFPFLLELIKVDSLASEGKSEKLKYYYFYRKIWLKNTCK